MDEERCMCEDCQEERGLATLLRSVPKVGGVYNISLTPKQREVIFRLLRVSQ